VRGPWRASWRVSEGTLEATAGKGSLHAMLYPLSLLQLAAKSPPPAFSG